MRSKSRRSGAPSAQSSQAQSPAGADIFSQARSDDQSARQQLYTNLKTVSEQAQGAPLVSAVTLDSFINFQAKLGLGTDNLLDGSSYGFNPITRNRQLLEWIHRGSWLGGVAVDVVAQDMTRRGVSLLGEVAPDDISLLERRATELRIMPQVREVIQWSRLYGGAICVALIDGHDTRDPLDPEFVGPGMFKGLLTLDRWMIEPVLDDLVDELGPNLGLPKFYRVNQNSPALRGKAIHHSRIMFRLVGVDLPYQQKLVENLWGLSVIERLYDRMVAFDTATTGAAQLVHKSYLRTLSVESMREIVAAGGPALDALTKYVDLMRRFQGIEGMSIIDAKDKLEVQGHSAFSGLSDALTQFGQQLAGALQIPLVRLFGQSPSGLNSSGESDLRTYYDHIASEQNDKLSTGMHKTFKMLAASEGVTLPEDFGVVFNSLWELSDGDKAEVANKVATAVSSAMDAQLISQQGAMKELRQSARVTGIFTNITKDDIDAADTQISPPQPEGLDEFGGLPMPGEAPPVPGALPNGDVDGSQAGTTASSQGTPPEVDQGTQG